MGSLHHRSPATLTAGERDRLIGLVAEGGAQTAEAVARGIPRAEALLFHAEGTILTGVAALKVPLPAYVAGLAARSGHPLPATPLELGYVAVDPLWRLRGIGSALCAETLRLAAGRALLATTGDDVMLHRILPRLGFRAVGRPWQGRQEPVFLMLRDAA